MRSNVESDAVSKSLDWKTRVLIVVARVAIRLLVTTWRTNVVGRDEYERLHHSGRSLILTFWHNQILVAAVNQRTPLSALISDHRDGEIIAQIISGYGLSSVRGSSSKGGARALLQMARELNDGRDVAITPDGPRGPRHSFAPGALMLAKRTGAPIMLMASHASRVWRLNTWDRFEVPKPFARVTVVYAPPLFLQTSETNDANADAERVAGMLHELAERAASLNGVQLSNG